MPQINMNYLFVKKKLSCQTQYTLGNKIMFDQKKILKSLDRLLKKKSVAFV